MRKKTYFTIMETIVAIAILAVLIDVIFDFFVSAARHTKQNDDAYAMSLAIESTLNRIDPGSYTLEDLKRTFEAEAENNSLQKRGMKWTFQEKGNEVEIRFFSKDKQIFLTELQLP